MPQPRHPALDRRDEAVTTGSVPQPRTTLQIWESLMPKLAQAEPVMDPEPGHDEPEVQVERVRDPYSGRIVEAAVAAVPPAQRGWREAMALKGVPAATIKALGGAR